MERSKEPRAYRADIDGLRAIAVLAVLFFHAFPGAVPGGFSGVDVFFVISGFLISGILFDRLREGGIRLSDFFSRRIKRLYPSLLVVVLCTLVFGWLLLLPLEFERLGKHAVAGLAYVSNFVFWQETGYFNPSSATKPLLHLWSLSIEEQFYLVYPVLLIVLRRFRVATFPVLLALTAASFTAGAALSASHPTFSYFAPLTRFWELLAGGLLALTLPAAETRFFSRVPRDVLSIGGAIAILMGFAFLGEERTYPGFWALIPVAGTVAVIAAGEGALFNRLFLARKTLVGVGLISYPLYLWHWPALVYARYLAGPAMPAGVAALALAASFGLAWCTSVFAEGKMRHRENAFAFKLVGASFVLIFAAGLGWSRSWGPRAARLPAMVAVDEALSDWRYQGRAKLEPFGSRMMWRLGDAAEKVLFVGDSQIEQYLPRVEALLAAGDAPNVSVLFSTAPGCPPLPKMKRDGHFADCEAALTSALERAREDDVKTVVFGSAWSYYVKDDAAAQTSLSAFSNVLKELGDRGKKVFVISGMPQGEEFHPLKMIRRSLTGLEFSPGHGMERSEFAKRSEPVLRRIRSAAVEGGATVIEPADVLCRDDRCPAVDEFGPRYKDEGHLRASFVEREARFIDVIFGKVSP